MNLPTPKRARRCWHALLVACGVLATSFNALAVEGATVRRLGDDLFVAGRDISLREAAPGDAALAGQNVDVSGPIGGDAMVAGRRVALGAPIGGDVYATGDEVRLNGAVGDSARIAGRAVTIGSAANVTGGASLAGARVAIDGRIGRYAAVAAGRTQVNGRIDGDLDVSGGELVLGPQAVIQGRLHYRGRQPAQIATGAQVQGGIEQDTADEAGGSPGGMVFFAGAWTLGWIVAGAVLLAAAPRVTRRVTQALRARPLASPLVGLLLLLALPLAIVVLLVTVIGIPLGLLAIVLYTVLLPLGFLASAAALGDAVVERRGEPARTSRRVFALVLAQALLFALWFVPALGWLVGLLALLFGTGAIALAFIAGRRQGLPA